MKDTKNKQTKISKHFQDCMFVACRLNKSPAIPKGKKVSDFLIDYKEANRQIGDGIKTIAIKLDIQSNQIFCIDCDSPELNTTCEELLPPTYVEQSPSGGTHRFYKLSEALQNINLQKGNIHLGEIRTNKEIIIISPSVARNKKGKLGSYDIINDVKELPLVTPEQVKAVVTRFITENEGKEIQTGLSEEVLAKIRNDSNINRLYEGDISGFASRSEAEQSLTNRLRASDFDKETVYKIVLNSKIGKLKEKTISYWERMWLKALNFVTQAKLDSIKEKISEAKLLKIMGVKDYRGYKSPKNHLVKELIGQKEIIMYHGPSGSYKSFLNLYEACCIATGKPFLGKYKTKKSAVLFISAENSIEVDKERLFQILNGLGVKTTKNIYILPRGECKDLFDQTFRIELCRTIRDLGIKIIYIDTINPVTASVDDNKAKDVTKVFNEFLKPLVDWFSVSIKYLHHTDKAGKNYLGSMKWFANSDQVFRVDRGEKLSPSVKIFNEKNRYGETRTMEVEVLFEDNKVDFRLLSEGEPSKYVRKKKMTQEEFFILKLNQLIKKKDTERQEVFRIFAENDIKYTPATLDRARKKWREE